MVHDWSIVLTLVVIAVMLFVAFVASTSMRAWFFVSDVKRFVLRSHRGERRGFELKPITGERPVLREERENDHG